MKDTRIQQFKINSYEVDKSAVARLTSIANYLQEIAYNHANELGVGFHTLLDQKMVWVLSELYIEMDNYPVWDEIITVETWPRPFERLFANRDFRITDKKGILIGWATTKWLVLDNERDRPVRPDESHFAFPLRTDLSFEKSPEMNIPDVGFRIAYSRKVSYSDLDVVGHVNNVKYIEWALDALPSDLLDNYSIKTFSVKYLHEARKGDEICISVSELRDNIICVSALREEDNKEIIRVVFRLDN